MNERLPWPPATAVRALGLVGLVWILGFGLFALSPALGGVVTAIALWLTAGLIHTAMKSHEETG